MVSFKRILKDYAEAADLSGLLALWGFVDDHTFMTKAGAVGVVYRLEGADYECLDHSQRAAVVQRFERALRQLDETFRVYQYVIKRHSIPFESIRHTSPVIDRILSRRCEYLASNADRLFSLELYLVVTKEAALGARGLSLRRTAKALSTDLDGRRTQLRERASAVAGQIADDVGPRLLRKEEAFAFLRQLVNYGPHKAASARLKHDTHLDVFVADSSLECQRDHLDVDGYKVKVLTMKEPPARTFAHMLQDLYAVPATFIACLEWQRRSNAAVRREIRSRQRHFFNKRVSLVNYVSPQTKPEEMLVDDSATATVNELGESLTELEVRGHFFGECSLSVVLFDRDPRRVDASVAECIKAFAGYDGVLHEERYNLLNAWLATVPGNSAHNLRRIPLLNTNCADLSFLFTLHEGDRASAHLSGRECVAVFETEYQTPYFWNLHHEDVGHTLILGATGSGKSFLLNFILAHAQKYDPFTVVFDLGGSYSKLTEVLGGSVWRMGLEHRDFSINPFCLPPTAENRHFLAALVRVLVQSGGQYQLTMQEDREIFEAVDNIYALDPGQRRLFTLANLLPKRLSQALQRWVQGGPYEALFDNAEDTLTFQQLQCFDFAGLDRYPLLLEPLLFYVLHRASATIDGEDRRGQLKIFALDEAWRFARDETLKTYIAEALKTWRKRNAAMILATQSSDDFNESELLRTVVESCPTKFFLANPGMDVERARSLFHLNATEARLIANLQPRRQALLKRPDLARVINLNVDPESYQTYTNATGLTPEGARATPSGDAREHVYGRLRA
jgi:type IV secretion system protein TrbE